MFDEYKYGAPASKCGTSIEASNKRQKNAPKIPGELRNQHHVLFAHAGPQHGSVLVGTHAGEVRYEHDDKSETIESMLEEFYDRKGDVPEVVAEHKIGNIHPTIDLRKGAALYIGNMDGRDYLVELYEHMFGKGPARVSRARLVMHCFVEGRFKGWW